MNYAIILAAGSGTRMENHEIPKCFIKVNNLDLYQYSLNTFNELEQINHIFLVVPKEYLSRVENTLKNYPKVSVISGGETRQNSVMNAIRKMKLDGANDDDIVLVHDAARPFVNQRIILDNIKMASKTGACVTAIKAIDTILKSKDDIHVSKIPDRSKLFNEQTPASFKFKILFDAHIRAEKENVLNSSDDCRLVMDNGFVLSLVKGDRKNFKVTNEIDLELLKALLNINY